MDRVSKQKQRGRVGAFRFTNASRSAANEIQTVGEQLKAVLSAKMSDQRQAAVRQVIAAFEHALEVDERRPASAKS
jgi:hypothetical protein